MIEPESVEVGGVYRTMGGLWTVTEIVDGRVHLRGDNGKEVHFGLVHFAQLVEHRVAPTEGIENDCR